MTSRPVRIAVIGSGWITRAHLHGILANEHIAPLGRPVEIMSLHARTEASVRAMADDFAIPRWSTRWEDAVEGDADVVAVLAANALHGPATAAALAAGKAILCEKPLTTDSGSAWQLARTAHESRALAAVGFNYRFHPATRLMYDLISSGQLGDVRHFRASYLQDWAAEASASRGHSGAGSVEDYSHIIDLLVRMTGIPRSVSAHSVSFGYAEDDAYSASLELGGGGLGALEASRFATGWKGHHRIEVNGSEGAAWWNMEDPNRLHVFLSADERAGLGGFRDILVSEQNHPLMAGWWPTGHVLGWEHGFANQWRAFLAAFIEGSDLDPGQADFADGAVVATIGEAISRSATTGSRESILIPQLDLVRSGELSPGV